MTIANKHISDTRNALLCAIRLMQHEHEYQEEVVALSRILDQTGCGTFEHGCDHLTQLIDVIVYG